MGRLLKKGGFAFVGGGFSKKTQQLRKLDIDLA